ncbi:MAG: methylmalonyl-CoA mutase, C-terminal domain [Thermococcaceae archaeon]|jgi:methylmalonyl-CoA mutase C-terminal domain/subunit|uniref:cobalamin B12-binding domain-containing protein n=1 Tax=Thermococcus TaxID=2263 RepID=UPI0005B2A6EF|nr:MULTISPECIES: cobalamin B12-binding domain-containing protein [Thermococcus]MDK2783074.1 methylmalonyl-CoA mutase, C-terminal domain [Thermococcaceae archaeon]MCA6214310.1 cobalamin B12-binding domain-containing protein [Thermococcus bergensis]MDK2983931.1 methylmalonyl-CoA mutase, C-terminal domain [Thermococcaceae archaeon]MDN5320926.1 methylmalonyl-CoA mutase, C-terminal domain [Thermococcaceae archaeon]MPW39138.1 methylmalonyl-CoA mutase [Thermococcus sp. 101 C5]
MVERSKVRVLIAKPGLDGHDRGAKVIARALRDAGFEVIYTGIRQTPEQIVETVIQEDIDVLGLSILSGAHMVLIPKILRLLEEKGIKPNEDILVLAGGIIPPDDAQELEKMGVARVFGPGSPIEEIIKFIDENIPKLKKFRGES